MFFIIYLILLLTNGMASNSDGCTETYDTSECIYNMYCVDYLNFENNYNYYSVRSDLQTNEKTEATCEYSLIINYNNYMLYPIYLVYKAHNAFDTIPVTNNNDYSVNNLMRIASLDLSNNNYDFVPTVRHLENLKKLSLSRNLLTVAKFSNENELPFLTEIDLSHNTINNIEVLNQEYLYKELRKIDLSHNYLVTIPETTFDSFHQLVSLDISHNFIDTLSYLTFEGIKQLLYLNLSHNRIADIDMSLLRFKLLKQLDMSSNEIKILKEHDFESLRELEEFNFSSNSISAIEKNVFQYMDVLNKLDLSNNDLAILDREIFTNLSSLKIIDLSRNNFKILPKGLFKGKTIYSFSITDNNLEGSLERGVFEGLRFVKEIDLSNQRISIIEDYAFFGLENLKLLLLNNNNIQVLSKMCFKTLQHLNRLDLSGNKLTYIEFDKVDLYSLTSLSLKSNYLAHVEPKHFHDLHALQFLDLSNNNISQLESNTFKILTELTHFGISNNPFKGTLIKSTFNGLKSLPSLDISGSLLTAIQNGSFDGMVQLKNLNLSHSNINELQYNSFIQTGLIETVDLSFNQLTTFLVNSTELVSLVYLFLNNNRITSMYSDALHGMPRLFEINLAHNHIENLHIDAFKDQTDLRDLDLSYNTNLKFNVKLIRELMKLNGLLLSGIKTGITFKQIGDTTLSKLQISFANITDIKALQLKELKYLDHLVMSNNNIKILEVGAFSNIKTLRNLDVSYNKITAIQPGTFKDNIELYSLNVSHNLLNTINYGIFRGLVNLNTLDVSYNKIRDLQNERFHDVKSLSKLIADHNEIKSITAEEFSDTSLMEISIGNNPLPCDILVNFKKNVPRFKVTAITFDDTSAENVDGVTCNMNKYHPYIIPGNGENALNEKILLNIRDILVNYSNKIVPEDHTMSSISAVKYLANITYQIEKSEVDHDKISHISNMTDTIVNENNHTNMLLERILNVITMNSVRNTPSLPVSKDNGTFENLLSYINKIKQDLDTVRETNDNIIKIVESKISSLNSRIDLFSATEKPKREKLVAKDESPQNLDSKSLFTETCVALILIILVGIVLYKFYKSRMYIRRRLSISTRELPGAMDSSTL